MGLGLTPLSPLPTLSLSFPPEKCGQQKHQALDTCSTSWGPGKGPEWVGGKSDPETRHLTLSHISISGKFCDKSEGGYFTSSGQSLSEEVMYSNRVPLQDFESFAFEYKAVFS